MRIRAEQPVVTLVLRDLADGPATVHCLAQAVGIATRNMRHYIRLLRESNQIYIVGYEQRTGPALPIYALGNEPDKKKPRRKYRR